MSNAAQPGPGKYGHLSEYVMRQTNARAAVLIVLDGNKGSGMSQTISWEGAEYDVAALCANDVRGLPALLREIANQIEVAK